MPDLRKIPNAADEFFFREGDARTSGWRRSKTPGARDGFCL
jgi:hypothetical protein